MCRSQGSNGAVRLPPWLLPPRLLTATVRGPILFRDRLGLSLYYPGILIQSALFHSQKSPGLDNELSGHSGGSGHLRGFVCPESILFSGNTTLVVLWGPPHPYSQSIVLVELTLPQTSKLAYDPGQANENTVGGAGYEIVVKRGSFIARDG